MNKRAISSFSLAIITALSIAGSYAFYVDKEVAHNTIVLESIELKVDEKQINDDGSIVEPEPIEVLPGTIVKRYVTATNLEIDAYIRATYFVNFKDADGNIINTADINHKDLVDIYFDEKWEQSGDWYYYNEVLYGGKTTTPLYYTVELSPEQIDNMYQNSTMHVTVVVQAVQSANNGDSALNALGWPELEVNND